VHVFWTFLVGLKYGRLKLCLPPFRICSQSIRQEESRALSKVQLSFGRSVGFVFVSYTGGRKVVWLWQELKPVNRLVNKQAASCCWLQTLCIIQSPFGWDWRCESWSQPVSGLVACTTVLKKFRFCTLQTLRGQFMALTGFYVVYHFFGLAGR
jgi:hypothetical protein